MRPPLVNPLPAQMTGEAGMQVPVIEDADIAWVTELLGLPATAFSGQHGTDPRLPAIRSMSPRDIEACPGSGKTTLLVAKLAILARKWTERRCGLCVLSHTNVARREIESRLGNTAAGQRLLGYPHFIGTIHGFVNEFLALPWLRSLGFPVEMIDDDVTLIRRWRKVPAAFRRALELRHRDEQSLRFKDMAFGLGNVPGFAAHTATYQAMQQACAASAREGYFCHDEMFVFAHDMIEKMPGITASLRMRFPFLFIDEVQDNSALQGTLLHRVFMEGDGPVTRQRLGDANQAIYQYTGQAGEEGPDAFPVATIRADIPNSFRFDQGIADLANPLGVEPQGLQGLREPGKDGRHAIFMFDNETIGFVLERYAAYLTEVFTEDELRKGTFTAVGAVHRPGGDDNVPRTVNHYWSAYDHEISRAEPQPKSFVQYVTAGRRLAQRVGEAHALVELVADGILRLTKLARPDLKLSRRKRRHRYVLELLAGNADATQSYLDMVRALCIEREALTQAAWAAKWQNTVLDIALAVTGDEIDADTAKEFLAWQDADEPGNDEAEQSCPGNIFRHPADDPTVEIRVGSIHAVKGETHMATLVLETFYRTHHLSALKAWLTGRKTGGNGETPGTKSRLRLHYVAMSRPSHLLCIAMRADTLNDQEIGQIIGQGWRVCQVTVAGVEWKEPPGM